MDLPTGPLNADVIGPLGTLQPRCVVVVVNRIDRLERMGGRIAVCPPRMPPVSAQRDAVGSDARDWRGSSGDIGDLVGEAERPLDDHLHLVADFDVFPKARRGPTRGFCEHALFDGDDFRLRPRVGEFDRA